MQILAQIVRGVAVVVLLSVCLELLMPKSALRPYIRTVTGLLLIVAVLTPLGRVDMNSLLPRFFTEQRFESENVIEAGEYLSEDWREAARLEAAAAAAASAESLLLLDGSVLDVSAEAFYEGESLHITLHVSGREDRSENWRRALSHYCGTEAENVNVVFRKEEKNGEAKGLPAAEG